MNLQKIKYPLIGGIIGLLISILFVIGLGDTLTFGLVDELLFVQVLFILSYPITALFCFLAEGRMCQGEEGIIILITGPIAGLLIGMLTGYLIYKFKNR